MEPLLTSLATGGGCGCKLSPTVLRDILSKMPVPLSDPNLLVDAATSDDAAVYKISDDTAIIATTDFFAPVVDDPYDFGRIAATNALSDIYAMGARPIFSLAIVGMPIAVLSPQTIQQIVKGGADVANAAAAPVAGGHSIDTAEPLYGLIALGVGHPESLKTNAGAKPGDRLILTKPLGIGVMSAALKKKALSDAGYQQMIASTTRLNKPGETLGQMTAVHAMTDVTGFGLLGHGLEMAKAAGVHVSLTWSKIPVFDEALALVQQGYVTGASSRNLQAVEQAIILSDTLPDHAKALLCDPQTSGGLLVSVAADAADDVISQLAANGFQAADIGTVSAGEPTISVS